MVLKLYGSSPSTCTRRVATVLKEKEVPYEFVPVDVMKGENKTLEYLAKQPFGQVPYIEVIISPKFQPFLIAYWLCLS